MASGARPSSNQRTENATNGRKPRGAHLHDHVDSCVVCGDRACNHHYYGVAACHGCKCFFWRSVKQGQNYTCRYQQNCDINPNYRNSCRFCRFQRCLQAGMQPESVRMQSKTTVKSESDHLPTNQLKRQATAYKSILESTIGPGSSESLQHSDNDPDVQNPVCKKSRKENMDLVNAIMDLERRVNQVADFSENEAPVCMLSVHDVFVTPEYLECYRTDVHYQVRLHRTTVEEMEFCKFRTLTMVFDFLNGFETIGLNNIPIEDKIKLLRNCYAPLTIFDIIIGTLTATKDENLLCLPTGITVSRNEELVQNSFMSQKLVNNIINTLARTIDTIDMTDTEVCLLKAIILLNQEVQGLAASTVISIECLRDRLHCALYQHCTPTSTESATIRFARLLHILPKLTLLARELIEHIRMVYTFQPEQKVKSNIFFELFGDIFEEERESFNMTKSS